MSGAPWYSRFFLVIAVLFVLFTAQAQEPRSSPGTDMRRDPSETQDDPLKAPLSENEKKAAAKEFKSGGEQAYKRWLEQDVPWIITDDERAVFKKLSNDEERDAFIEAFWVRRDPTPDTPENELKEEHYGRISYANEHFSSGVPGWRADRGRIYIVYGPPDEIESHPSGGIYDRTPQEGGRTSSSYPFETWRYRHLEDVGEDIVVEYVDPCMCGDYHMTMDPNDKEALIHISRGPAPDRVSPDQSREFEDMQRFFALNRPPKTRFKDLQEKITTKIDMNMMPFDVHTDFVKATSGTVLVPMTIQVKNRDLTFVNRDGVERGVVNIFGRLTTIGGRVAQTFEDTVQVDVPQGLLPKVADNSSVYWKALPLLSGRYLLELAVKDVNGERVGTWCHGITVPAYADDSLATSSLILADKLERAGSKVIGGSNFVIGDIYIRPRVEGANKKPVVFRRSQKINFWMQAYSLGIDARTHKPSATFEYDVVNVVTKKPVIHTVESTGSMGNVGDQLTLQKTIAGDSLPPGAYQVEIRVNDAISKQAVHQMAMFAVE